MLSRVADSIYWLSRYIERAENVARFIEVNLNLSLDMPSGNEQQWWPLVTTSGDHDDFKKRYTQADEIAVIKFLTFDADNSNSIYSCVSNARENARTVRDVISSDMWEQVNQFYLMVRSAATDAKNVIEAPQEFFRNVRFQSHLFSGLTDSTLSHGEGWHFSRLGRLLERADKTSRILDVKYFILLPNLADIGTTLDEIQWSSLLRSASGLEMYRQRFGRITPQQVVEFLVLDKNFPRAVLYCLTRAHESLHAISGVPLGTFSNTAEQRLGQLYSELAYAHPDEIIKGGLHEFIDDLQQRLNLVGEGIFQTFFAMRPINNGQAPAGLTQTQLQI